MQRPFIREGTDRKTVLAHVFSSRLRRFVADSGRLFQMLGSGSAFIILLYILHHPQQKMTSSLNDIMLIIRLYRHSFIKF